MRRPHLIMLGCACAAIAACGGDGTVASTFSADVGGAGGASGIGGSGAGATGASSTTAASSAQASSAASSAASSSSASSSSSSSSSTGGPGCDYTAPNDCAGALELTPISGDTGADVRTVSGSTAKWLKVHVTEDSNFSTGLSYTVTIASPPGVDWDLYVYTGDASLPDCFASVTPATGTPESLHDAWGDTLGVDDGKWITFEVRYVSGAACGAAAAWTVTVAGDTP